MMAYGMPGSASVRDVVQAQSPKKITGDLRGAWALKAMASRYRSLRRGRTILGEAYAMTMQNQDVTASCMVAGAGCEYRCEACLDV
jgi:hypothetical protein